MRFSPQWSIQKIKSLQLRLGAGTLCIALFLGLVGIPRWVSSPSNVSNIVLSPTFWPYVLTVLTGLIALGLLLVGWRMDSSPIEEDEHQTDNTGASWLRMAGLALIMILTMFALPRLGMVWTSMVAFIATALLFRTRHPLVAVICAIVIPLLLYAFFAHVAGIAIPQGDFVRLP